LIGIFNVEKLLKIGPWQHSWQRPANFDKSALGKQSNQTILPLIATSRTVGARQAIRHPDKMAAACSIPKIEAQQHHTPSVPAFAAA
jgi:hypothetical protein